MDGKISSTARILTAAMLAVAGPLQAQEKPVVTAAATSPTTVDLGWTAPAGATQYGVQRGPGPGGPWSLLGPPVSQPAYTDATAQPGTTYAYRVRTKVAGQNVVSDPALVTTPPVEDPPGGRGGGRSAGGEPAAGMPAAAVGPAIPGVQPLPVQQGPVGAKDAAAVGPLISSLPNLVCDVERTSLVGQASFQITVKNTGGAGAGSSTVELIVTQGELGQIIPPTQFVVGPLAPGGSITLPPVVVKEDVSHWVETLGVNAEATVDAGAAVTEISEMDNVCSDLVDLGL